jgi:hypothetical protein
MMRAKEKYPTLFFRNIGALIYFDCTLMVYQIWLVVGEENILHQNCVWLSNWE